MSELCNITATEGFRVNAKIRRQLAARKRRIERRLDKSKLGDCSQPVMSGPATSSTRSPSGRAAWATAAWARCVLLVRRFGLAEAIDRRLHLLKIHLPYHESDHVLNLAYNALCDGDCLEDLELRRNDEVFLDALGARRIPDPTTAGDFCRRFERTDVRTLQDVFNETRLKVWARAAGGVLRRSAHRHGRHVGRSPAASANKAWTSPTRACGAIIRWSCRWPTRAKCCRSSIARATAPAMKERPTKSIARWRSALPGGFRRVLLRGDTDFTQTKHLDRWGADPRVRFIFGIDCMPNLQILADDLPDRPGKRWNDRRATR